MPILPLLCLVSHWCPFPAAKPGRSHGQGLQHPSLRVDKGRERIWNGRRCLAHPASLGSLAVKQAVKPTFLLSCHGDKEAAQERTEGRGSQHTVSAQGTGPTVRLLI